MSPQEGGGACCWPGMYSMLQPTPASVLLPLIVRVAIVPIQSRIAGCANGVEGKAQGLA